MNVGEPYTSIKRLEDAIATRLFNVDERVSDLNIIINSLVLKIERMEKKIDAVNTSLKSINKIKASPTKIDLKISDYSKIEKLIKTLTKKDPIKEEVNHKHIIMKLLGK